MPEFNFRPVPLIPASVALLTSNQPNLPILPTLPKPPTLPDLPNIETPKLPDLPAPPTIPDLFGYISQFTDILKMISKILGILHTIPFAPEWRVGDMIAQTTERQGTMPSDYTDLETPQTSQPFTDQTQTNSSVNFQEDTSFIQSMGEQGFQSIDTTTNNISDINDG